MFIVYSSDAPCGAWIDDDDVALILVGHEAGGTRGRPTQVAPQAATNSNSMTTR